MSLLVIGLGNPDRGDDAAGHQTVSQVHVGKRILRRDCTDLLDLFDGQRRVVIVDAMRSGQSPGSIHRFDLPGDELPTRGFTSSHTFGLADTLELARALGRLPESVVVFGIEVGTTALGDTPTSAVTEAARQVADEIDRLEANQCA